MTATIKFFLVVLMVAGATILLAQTPSLPPGVSPSQGQEIARRLAERNIDPAALKARLLERGIDTDNLNPEELLQLRPEIEATIAEMEAEQLATENTARRTAAQSAEKIKDAVDDGASVEEAITEVTTEEVNEGLPMSTIYGHNIFRNKSLQVFRAAENATPPDSYPIKPGDEIGVSIFGASQSDFILDVDELGFLTFPNGNRIPIAGVPLGDARALLSQRLSQFYSFRPGQLSIRIQVARTVTVNIFGEVENNGTFSMSALNTGFNALVAAGGPTDDGSVRQIQLIKGDKTILLDIYEFLNNPVQRPDLFLANNATIFVPPANNIVEIAGGIRRPMRYELLPDETISDLIRFAGGSLPRAENSNIRVIRFVKGVLKVVNVDLTREPDFTLQQGDQVEVPIIENPIEDFVSIEGAVLLPGQYAFDPDMKLSTLLELGRLRPGARQDVAFLFRKNDDGTQRLQKITVEEAANISLRRGDRLRVLSQTRFIDESVFTVTGAVRDTTVTLPFPQDGTLTLEEAILLAGGLATNALDEVMLIRTPLSNRRERIYERINLMDAKDVTLQPLDRIVVYENERYTDPAVVRISGAIRSSGTYVYAPSLKLRDLIYMAGGLTISAARNRVEVFRLQFLDGERTKTRLATVDLDAGTPFELEPYDEVIVRSAADFEFIQSVEIMGEVDYPGEYALLRDNERLSDIIARAGGLTPEAFPEGATLYRPESNIGYVVLDLDRAVTDSNSPTNMVMKAGDTLFIPKRQDLVTIYTEGTLVDRFGRDSTTVTGSFEVAYQGEKSAGWYINRYAGGFEEGKARRRWTTVEYANGQVRETQSFLGIHNYPEVLPGASIRVPVRPEKQQRARRPERFDWIGLTQIVVTAATTLTTFILIRQ